LARFLADKGYVVYVSEWHPIIRYGIRHDWNCLVRYPCELSNKKGWGNLLAFRDAPPDQDVVAAVRKVLKLGEPTEPVAQAGGKVIPGTQFTELSANHWRYAHSKAGQSFWQMPFGVVGSTVGRNFTANLRLTSNQRMTVLVSIGRYGNLEYEGANKRILLIPSVGQNVRVSKEFSKPHTAVKVQLEVLHLEGTGTADLTIESVAVVEALTSVQRRLAEGEQNLRTANRLFRDGDYATAMCLYLLLHKQHPLKVYADNALMAARKLGMDWVLTVDELVQLM
jgi:hypothetical protein